MRAERSGTGPSAVGGIAGGSVAGTNTGVGTGDADPDAACDAWDTGAAWDCGDAWDGGAGWRARIQRASAGMPAAESPAGVRAGGVAAWPEDDAREGD